MHSRQQLRKEKRLQRRKLTVAQQCLAAQALERQLLRSAEFRNARRIACYLAQDGEIDLISVMASMRGMKKECYIPVLDVMGSRRLWFAPIHQHTQFQLNRYGIPEPRVSARDYVLAHTLDLILVPLVAFDRQGNRLGMGGGFYDSTLAYLKRRQYWFKPHIFGVAHDFQRLEMLHCASWDVPMQSIVTDQCIYQVRKR